MGSREDRPGGAPARPYRSPARERQARRTRAGIVAAAQRRFLEHGYAGTTMRGVALAALEGARVDGDIAAIADQLMAQREVMAAWLVDGLLRRSPLRAGVDRESAVDTVWALMDPALFHRLTGDRQWSRDRFRRWFTGSVLRLLPEDSERAGAGATRGAQPELWVDRAATAG